MDALIYEALAAEDDKMEFIDIILEAFEKLYYCFNLLMDFWEYVPASSSSEGQ